MSAATMASNPSEFFRIVNSDLLFQKGPKANDLEMGKV